MKRKEVRIWVHPSFHKQLKKEAVEADLTIVKLTERKAKDKKNETMFKF